MRGPRARGRAAAHPHAAGADAAKRLAAAGAVARLKSYYPLYAVLAEFEAELGNHAAAARHLRRAIDLTGLKSERALLSERLRECEAQPQRAG